MHLRIVLTSIYRFNSRIYTRCNSLPRQFSLLCCRSRVAFLAKNVFVLSIYTQQNIYFKWGEVSRAFSLPGFHGES